MDLYKAIEKTPKPVIVAMKQDFPEEIKRKNGLCGGNMMTAFKSLGVIGVISDGPSRDLDEVRPMGLQYMLTGVCAGHGDFNIHAIMLMYGKEASNRKQEIDRQHHTIPNQRNQRPKDKHYGNVHNRLWNHG